MPLFVAYAASPIRYRSFTRRNPNHAAIGALNSSISRLNCNHSAIRALNRAMTSKHLNHPTVASLYCPSAGTY